MIVDRLDAWVRDGMPTTPERIAWAKAYMAEEGAASLAGNYIPSEPQPPRKPITLSSHIYCHRQLFLKVSGQAVEDRAPRVYNNWFVGRMVECSVVARCILAGMPVISPLYGGKSQRRVYMDLGGPEPYGGSLDLVLAADPKERIDSLAVQEAYWSARKPVIIADVKSRSDKGFREDVANMSVGNDFGYEDQLGGYALACEAEGRPVNGLVFVVQRKATGHEAEIPCPRPHGLKDKFRAAFAAGTGADLPPLPDWATLRTVRAPGGAVEQIESKRCGYCDGLPFCWPGFDQVMVGGKVEWRRKL